MKILGVLTWIAKWYLKFTQRAQDHADALAYASAYKAGITTLSADLSGHQIMALAKTALGPEKFQKINVGSPSAKVDYAGHVQKVWQPIELLTAEERSQRARSQS